jgi:hypothetical protein
LCGHIVWFEPGKFRPDLESRAPESVCVSLFPALEREDGQQLAAGSRHEPLGRVVGDAGQHETGVAERPVKGFLGFLVLRVPRERRALFTVHESQVALEAQVFLVLVSQRRTDLERSVEVLACALPVAQMARGDAQRDLGFR